MNIQDITGLYRDEYSDITGLYRDTYTDITGLYRDKYTDITGLYRDKYTDILGLLAYLYVTLTYYNINLTSYTTIESNHFFQNHENIIIFLSDMEMKGHLKICIESPIPLI